MSIIIGADLVPTESNYNLFIENKIESIIGPELRDVLNKSDYNIFNLEAPLTDNLDSKIYKNGPSIRIKECCVSAIKEMNVSMLSLANNHIMDYGENGLLNTLKQLNKFKISYVGVGNSVYEAKKPFYFDVGKRKYGVYSCAEHEFSIATNTKPGANPYDALETYDDIEEAKSKCNYLIVLYHGGKEFYQYPSPLLQRQCRKMVDKGANLVICQHSHCIGCQEIWKDATIVYGQGNFLFDDGTDSLLWNEGMLVRISDDLEIDYIPIEHINNTVRMSGENREKILLDFFKRSEKIQDINFIENQYRNFASLNIEEYLLQLKGTDNIFIRCLNKIFKFNKKTLFSRYRIYNRLYIQNIMECEAHRELLIEGLKIKNEIKQ